MNTGNHAPRWGSASPWADTGGCGAGGKAETLRKGRGELSEVAAVRTDVTLAHSSECWWGVSDRDSRALPVLP